MTEIRKITLQFPSLRAFLAAYGERISPDGMLLRGGAPPAAGSTVDIEVVVAEGMRLLRARGETLWSGATGAGGRKEAAVRFLELDDASRTLIGKIVDQRRREGAETFNLDDVSAPRQARSRDLTVPAAVSGESGGAEAAGDSVFDLEEPPAEPAADMFSAPAGGRQPAPPVPLLAEPDPGPFDLAVGGADEEIAAAGLELEPAAGAGGEPEPPAQPDLSELFGGDEPQGAPARGRTEAFPPSFLDEVEAELEAADTSPTGEGPDGSYSLVDTGELKLRLGSPVEEPEAVEAAAESTLVMPEAPPEAEPEVESPNDAEVAAEPEPEVDEPAAGGVEPPLEPEAVDTAEDDPEPDPLVVDDVEAEAQEGGAAPEPEPSETPLEVARAFTAERGPETVEIPILETPAVETPTAGAPVDAVAPPPDGAPTPALEEDNLLSIPEFQGATAAAEEPAVGEAGEDQLLAAESLRGAASRSRHVGTWLLIALLVGALGVAGYFMAGMMRGEEKASEAAPAIAGPAAESTAPEPLAAGGPTGVEAGAEGTDTADEPPVEPAAAVSEGAAVPPPPAEAQPAEPAAPLTGLNRITWSETEAETILALIGDGAIPRERIEVATLGGDRPRLVIKIAGVARAFQPAVLEVGTSHVARVRTGLQAGGELHIVVDMAGAGVSMRDLAARGSRVEVRVGAE